MTLQDELPLHATDNIVSVERANVHLEGRLSVHVGSSGAPRMRESTVSQER
jgi:hypothetical protein